MIRKNSLLCKLIHENRSAKFFFDDTMSSFDPSKESCPSCHSRGNCCFHKFYRRFLVDYHQGKIECFILRITVVRCSSCGAYHSILPDVIIPYQIYSIPFILHVLDLYFNHRDTIAGICERFGITPPTIYRWRDQFLQHKALWLGVLKNRQQTSSQFLSQLIDDLDFSTFNTDFIHRFILSFLQSHRMQYRRCSIGS